MSYDFAANPLKLQRAIAAVPADSSEDVVKAEYIRIGGLVRTGYDTPVEESAEAPSEEPVETQGEESSEEKPKKAAKKTKTK